MRLTAVAALINLGEPDLIAWIERGWLHPEQPDTGPVFPGIDRADIDFADIDIARVRLINDLRTLMRIEDETIPMVLSLLDQVYDTRARLRSVLRAVEAQPEPVRRAILTAIG